MTNAEIIKRLESIASAELVVDGLKVGAITKEAFEAIQETARLAISALSRDRWISVESNLPVSGLLVLAATEYGVYYGFLNGNRKWFVANNALEDAWTWNPLITHWMLLPEPPKEDKP